MGQKKDDGGFFQDVAEDMLSRNIQGMVWNAAKDLQGNECQRQCKVGNYK